MNTSKKSISKNLLLFLLALSLFSTGFTSCKFNVKAKSKNKNETTEKEKQHEGFAFTDNQYEKALWMTTRFYGAQRTGSGVNWLTYGLGTGDYTGGKSFLKDSDGDYDLNGGWADTCEYSLYGHSFFYTTYVLLLGYSEFKNGYSDYYDADYNCYTSTGKYSWEDKTHKPNGTADILDECKYAVDWIKKAVRSDSAFYFQKGDYDSDSPEFSTITSSPTQSTYTNINGGESDQSRSFYVAFSGATSMSSLAGASLAVMYRLTGDEECLEKAKTAYAFAVNNGKGNTASGDGYYYPAKDKYYPDLTILCAELYRATGDTTYSEACNTNSSQWIKSSYNHNYSLNCNDTEDLALYAYCASMGKDALYYEDAKANLNTLVSSYKVRNSYLLSSTDSGNWDELKYMASQCFAMALNSKLQGETEINPYVLKSVEYIMGNNDTKFSFIVGFGSKSPEYPHYKNYYRMDNVAVNDIKTLFTDSSSYPFRQLGGLVGGSYDGTYTDSPDNLDAGTPGIENNSGLVGALAYINTFLK